MLRRVVLVAIMVATRLPAAEIRGVIARSGAPVYRARITLVRDGVVRETRTDLAGRYTFLSVEIGSYTLGASARDLEYFERVVQVSDDTSTIATDFAMEPETNRGRWDTVGRFEHNTFGGTNSGVLLADGRIIYCHDTIDPVIFDPPTNEVTYPPKSPRIQGCHAARLLPDGRVVYVGGADIPTYGPGTRQVKAFDPSLSTWQELPDLTAERWYPTLVQLANGELLAIGGGGAQNPIRTATAEVCDPVTMSWSRVGSIAIGNEVSPVVLLRSGEVLMTHRPPQLFDPTSRTWRPAADFVQGDRMPNGDHADHEIVMMPNGDVVAVGYKPFSPAPSPSPSIVEIYNVAKNEWRRGPTIAPLRSRPSIVLLPDRRILVLGGYKEESGDPTPVNAWGYVALTDLLDIDRTTWRRLENMATAREYHAMPILLPDGRVVVVGGEGAPGIEPETNVIEIFSPPYLFRGPRPAILNLSRRTVARGGTLSFDIANTVMPTSVVLIGTAATTHFMDSGTGRYAELPFTQSGTRVTATLPFEPASLPVGHYLLFALLDDIPSRAEIIRVDRGATRRRSARH